MFINRNFPFISKISSKRGLVFGLMIVLALFAFEVFNFGTTEYALQDLIGDLKFLGISWATILAVAFCGIDFAGIARIFTPERGSYEETEVWYLFGAWLLAASMNALLTWWGVSVALLNHNALGNVVVDQETLLKVVPIFVAIMVWLIRVLTIGSFSLAGDRLFSQATMRVRSARNITKTAEFTGDDVFYYPQTPPQMRESPVGFNPAPKPGSYNHEPTFRPVSMPNKRTD
jgi:hypothetical protein